MTSAQFIFWTAYSFLYRSWKTTSVLAFMICISVATLVFLFALATGTNDAMIRNSVGLYSGHIQGSGLAASFPYQELYAPGVRHVLKRTSLPGIIDNGGQAAMVVLTGIDIEKERSVTGLHKKIVAGMYPERGVNSVLIGQAAAIKIGRKVGETLQFRPDFRSSPTVFTIAGIYETGISGFDDQLVFCDNTSIPQGNSVLSVAIFLEEGVEPRRVIETYSGLDIGENHFNAWYEFMPDLKQLIELNKICMNLLTVIVFAIVAIGVACAFVIFILKNIREYGILKTMGFSPSMLSGLIIAKVTLLNIFAAVAGAFIGAVLCSIMAQKGIDISTMTSHNRYFVISGIIYPRLTVLGLWLPPLLSFIFSSVASLWPIMIVLRNNASSILRNT